MLKLKNLSRFALAASVVIVLSCDDEKDSGTAKNLDCVPESLQSSVLAFYPFTDGKILDFSGSKHHLENETDAESATDRHGDAGNAFAFDNDGESSELLTFEDPTFLDGVNTLTISLWYYVDLEEGEMHTTYKTFIRCGELDWCDGVQQWGLGIHDCGRDVFTATESVWSNLVTSGEGGISCQAEADARAGEWHHVVATVNATTKEMKLYRDGELDDETDDESECGDWSDVGDLIIGEDLNGKIDDIILLDKVLTAEEVEDLFEMTTCN